MSAPLQLGLLRAPEVPQVSLRPYQQRAHDQVLELATGGARDVLVVAPTGAGKSVSIGALAAHAIERDEPVLVLQHRQELISQNFNKGLACGLPRELLGVIMGDDPRRNPGALVQYASVDTLRRRVGTPRMPRARWVIVDEAHRAMAKGYQAILGDYPDAVHVGYTATPWRLDGQGLADLYNQIVVVATIPELIGGGWLVPLRCYSHPSKPDLSHISVRGGDFAEDQLHEAMRSRLLLASVTEQYKARAQGRSAFGFAVNVAHAEELAQVCRDAGIPSAAVSGETDDGVRKRALADLRSGALKVLWNCALFTEGTDVEEVKAVILARPTLSRALAFQMIGRGMRVSPGTGFSDCVVLDHAGVLQIHGHPLEPQDYSLHPTRPKRGGPAMTKDCPKCQMVVPLGQGECPGCGHTWERAERTAPPQVTGQLVEMKERPAVIMPAAAELGFCKRALQKALDQHAASPERYALAILERQLRRAPAQDVFARAVAEVLRPALAPTKPAGEMPGWLKKGLGITTPAARPAPVAAPAHPVAADEDLVEVEF